MARHDDDGHETGVENSGGLTVAVDQLEIKN